MAKKVLQRSFDYFGNVAVIKFSDKSLTRKTKVDFAKDLMKRQSAITTVLEKTGKFKGRLRTMETTHLAGEKTKEVLYKENGCSFRFNLDTTYFSPRLASERQELASLLKPTDEVLVMFAGVAPFSIVLAKQGKPKRLVSNEINRVANQYAKQNVVMNKVQDIVEIFPGDAKKAMPKLHTRGDRFDVIVMARPQLKDTFLEQALLVAKKGTLVYYYDFCHVDEVETIVQKVSAEVARCGRSIRVLQTKLAGAIAPYHYRVRMDFVVQ